jgi:glycine dehydrogenase subunit 2
MGELLHKSRTDADWMKGAPYSTPVRRLDDVKAARDLDLGYVPPKTGTAGLNAGEPAHI